LSFFGAVAFESSEESESLRKVVDEISGYGAIGGFGEGGSLPGKGMQERGLGDYYIFGLSTDLDDYENSVRRHREDIKHTADLAAKRDE